MKVIHDDGGPVEMRDASVGAAPHLVQESVYQQAYAAVPIETRGIVVEHDAGTGDVTMWVATQAPHEHRAFCARLLDIPEHRVRVIARDTGGGRSAARRAGSKCVRTCRSGGSPYH